MHSQTLSAARKIPTAGAAHTKGHFSAPFLSRVDQAGEPGGAFFCLRSCFLPVQRRGPARLGDGKGASKHSAQASSRGEREHRASPFDLRASHPTCTPATLSWPPAAQNTSWESPGRPQLKPQEQAQAWLAHPPAHGRHCTEAQAATAPRPTACAPVLGNAHLRVHCLWPLFQAWGAWKNPAHSCVRLTSGSDCFASCCFWNEQQPRTERQGSRRSPSARQAQPSPPYCRSGTPRPRGHGLPGARGGASLRGFRAEARLPLRHHPTRLAGAEAGTERLHSQAESRFGVVLISLCSLF